MPLVSIVTPTYNSENFIFNTYESIKSQSYTNWEWIIVDDCSADKTLDVIASIVEYDDRINVFRNKTNLGAAKSRNFGMTKSNGDFIAFLDSDDIWLQNKLEIQINCMIKASAHGSCTLYKASEYVVGYDKEVLCLKDILFENKIGCSTVVLSREFVNEQNIKFPDQRKRQDYALWLNILRRKIKFINIGHVLVNYSIRKDSLSRTSSLDLIKYNFKALRENSGLGFFGSIFCLFFNIVNSLKKRMFYKMMEK